MNQRLKRQMRFLDEAEKLKVVYRRNRTVDGERFENSAEHSWHVALMALVVSEHAETRELDMLKIITMLLIHDLVEIDAGDTWLYSSSSAADQTEKEESAATKLYSMLPDDQAKKFRALWDEFQARESPEAKFAAAIDALQPLSNHLITAKNDNADEKPRRHAVMERKRHIAESSQTLWSMAIDLINKSVEKGLYE